MQFSLPEGEDEPRGKKNGRCAAGVKNETRSIRHGRGSNEKKYRH